MAHESFTVADHDTPARHSIYNLDKKVCWVLGAWTVDSDCDYVDLGTASFGIYWVLLLDITVKNPTTSDCHYYLFVEDDYTTTNYYSQYLQADGTGVSGGRVSTPSIGDTSAGERALISVRMTRDPDGYFRYFSAVNHKTGSVQRIQIRAGSKTAPVVANPSLRLSASVSGGIGAGTKIILTKLYLTTY